MLLLSSELSELSRVDDLENLEIVLLKSFEISELFDGVLNCKINSLLLLSQNWFYVK